MPNTLKDFLVSLKQLHPEHFKLHEAIDYAFDDCEPSELAEYLAQSVDESTLLGLRGDLSDYFARRISGICSEGLWNSYHRSHALSIQQFDDLAREQGIAIVEKRACVSFTELMRDEGVITVSPEGVKLTPKGESLAEDVRREIEEG